MTRGDRTAGETTVAYVQWILRWRWPVLLAILTATAIALGGLQHIRYLTTYRVFFSADNPQLIALDELHAVYTKQDSILFVLEPRTGDVFTPEVLGAVRWLTEAAWRIPYAIRVDSLTNHQHTSASGDDLTVADLVPAPARLSDGELRAIREIALGEPSLVKRLVSPDGRTAAVNITVHRPEENHQEEVAVAIAHARAVLDEVRAAHPDLTIAMTGTVPFDNALLEITTSDMRRLVPVMYAFLVVTMLVLLRSLTAAFITVVVIALSAATAVGLTAWLGITLTAASTSAPTIILTVAIADSIHVLVWMLRGMRSGLQKEVALAESFRVNVQPVFLTSLTTALGFLTLNFSDSPPWRDLGNIAALGVVLAWVYSMTLLPVLVSLLPVRARVAMSGSGMAMQRFADWVIVRRRSLLWGMTALIFILGAFIPRIELNDQFVEYVDRRVEFRRDTDFATDRMSGIAQIHFSLGAGEPGGVSEPAYLDRVERFASWLRAHPGVDHVSTVTDILKRLNRSMHGDDPAWYRIPERRELAAQYLLLYEISLPYGLDLTDQINIDKSATRVTITADTLTTREFKALKADAQTWLAEHTPPEMRGEGTGLAVMFASMTERNIRSMLLGTLLALVVISLSLIIALRSVKFGLVSLIPNLVPPIMAFGVWALTVGEVGISASTVTATSLGIIVDDTVHFLSKYLRARREKGLSPEDAVRYAYSTVGSALWITSAILICGFCVLILSPMRFTSTMGLLSAIAIFAALAADFLLLPPLLIALDRRKTVPAVTPLAVERPLVAERPRTEEAA